MYKVKLWDCYQLADHIVDFLAVLLLETNCQFAATFNTISFSSLCK